MSGDLFSNGGQSGHTYNTNKSGQAYQLGYARTGWQGAQDLLNQGPYQGPFIGQQSPYTVQAQQMLAQRATDPNSLTAQAQRQYGSTIAGDYMNPNSNPYFQNYLNDALGQAKSQFMSQYGGNAGTNVGNSGYQEALGRALGSQAINAYSNLYNQERQNQLNASAVAPALDYNQAQALFGAGQSQEQRSQAEADAQRQAYMENWANLARYFGALQGNYGGSNSQEGIYFSNPFNAFGSTASTGMGMYNGMQGAGGGGAAGGVGSGAVAGGMAGGTAASGGMGAGASDLALLAFA